MSHLFNLMEWLITLLLIQLIALLLGYANALELGLLLFVLLALAVFVPVRYLRLYLTRQRRDR